MLGSQDSVTTDRLIFLIFKLCEWLVCLDENAESKKCNLSKKKEPDERFFIDVITIISFTICQLCHSKNVSGCILPHYKDAVFNIIMINTHTYQHLHNIHAQHNIAHSLS